MYRTSTVIEIKCKCKTFRKNVWLVLTTSVLQGNLLLTTITGYYHCITTMDLCDIIITLLMLFCNSHFVMQEKYSYGTDWCAIIYTTVQERNFHVTNILVTSYTSATAHMAKKYKKSTICPVDIITWFSEMSWWWWLLLYLEFLQWEYGSQLLP